MAEALSQQEDMRPKENVSAVALEPVAQALQAFPQREASPLDAIKLPRYVFQDGDFVEVKEKEPSGPESNMYGAAYPGPLRVLMDQKDQVGFAGGVVEPKFHHPSWKNDPKVERLLREAREKNG